MEVSFYLKRPDAEKQTVIFARVSYRGLKLKYYTPEQISPQHWNKEKHKAKETRLFPQYLEFNARLNTIEAAIKTVYRRYLNDNRGNPPTLEGFKQLIDQELNISKKGSRNDFFSFFEGIINDSNNGVRLHRTTGQPFSKNTIKAYVTTLNHLIAFQSKAKKQINFGNITYEFYREYTEFLIKSQELTSNSIGKDIKIIKAVMNEATERGVNQNLNYKSRLFHVTKEESTSIFLTKEELAQMEYLDLTSDERLEKTRDLFLIGCYTGLRYSDYTKLRKDHIKDNLIHITQTKTKDPIIIPIHPVVKGILKKYDNQLPKSISNQKANQYLKEIGKLLTCLHVQVSKTYTKGGREVNETLQKWEMITTHTARRSFATNEVLAKRLSITTIMAMTGHRTEQSFRKYIKLTSNDQALIAREAWKQAEN
ncbi:MAG: site-specific integrase [Williamsia sp.]|nr:site-specific integrase [Williamsia sp.]